mgnify:CR=1 FL=1
MVRPDQLAQQLHLQGVVMEVLVTLLVVTLLVLQVAFGLRQVMVQLQALGAAVAVDIVVLQVVSMAVVVGQVIH